MISGKYIHQWLRQFMILGEAVRYAVLTLRRRLIDDLKSGSES